MKVIVTIPAYNEEKSIGKVIGGIKTVMNKEGHKYEILVINDGSTDKTEREAKEAGAIVYSHPHNYGLAETFKTEMKKVLERNGDVIVHIDADMQYLPEEIPKLLEPVIKGEADLVLGSRFAGVVEEMSSVKRWGNKAFSRVISGITSVKITDGQTGFRAFTKELAQNIKITSRHTYTQEMIIRSVKEKFRVKEVPVTFKKRKEGESRLISNPLEYAAKAWINILRVYRDYEPLKFFGRIGASLMFIGFLIGLYILWLFFNVGFGVIDTKIPTILLGVLFFLTGMQIMLFGFLADKNS